MWYQCNVRWPCFESVLYAMFRCPMCHGWMRVPYHRICFKTALRVLLTECHRNVQSKWQCKSFKATMLSDSDFSFFWCRCDPGGNTPNSEKSTHENSRYTVFVGNRWWQTKISRKLPHPKHFVCLLVYFCIFFDQFSNWCFPPCVLRYIWPPELGVKEATKKGPSELMFFLVFLTLSWLIKVVPYKATTKSTTTTTTTTTTIIIATRRRRRRRRTKTDGLLVISGEMAVSILPRHWSKVSCAYLYPVSLGSQWRQ